MRSERPVDGGITTILCDRLGTSKFVRFQVRRRVQASEQIQAIIRLKHIYESGPHHIFSIIPICPSSVIPEITFVPQGTSPYILLTIWFSRCGHPVWPEYSGCGPGYR